MEPPVRAPNERDSQQSGRARAQSKALLQVWLHAHTHRCHGETQPNVPARVAGSPRLPYWNVDETAAPVLACSVGAVHTAGRYSGCQERLVLQVVRDANLPSTSKPELHGPLS